MDYHWNWGIFFVQVQNGDETYLDWLINGFGWTVAVSIGAWIIALSLGSVIGTLRTTNRTWVVALGNAWVECFRNVPLLVQMLLWFFVVPEDAAKRPFDVGQARHASQRNSLRRRFV